MENLVHLAANPGPVFFERGVLDGLCGLDHIRHQNESELSMWLSKYQYFPRVFVLPPREAIYENDAVRDHTFEHAEWVDRIVQEWYRRCGYHVLEVPMVSVDERCMFVLQALGRRGRPNNSLLLIPLIRFHNRPPRTSIAPRNGGS
jgi:predicted ATPase